MFLFLNCSLLVFQQTSEVMNAEMFSALARNVGKLREMKKAHEEMAAEIAVLKLEKEQACGKWIQLHFFEIFISAFLLIPLFA